MSLVNIINRVSTISNVQYNPLMDITKGFLTLIQKVASLFHPWESTAHSITCTHWQRNVWNTEECFNSTFYKKSSLSYLLSQHSGRSSRDTDSSSRAAWSTWRALGQPRLHDVKKKQQQKTKGRQECWDSSMWSHSLPHLKIWLYSWDHILNI